MSPARVGPPPLFPQLSGGRNGPGAETVGRHQRRRLMGAVLEAVARHGYAPTTVGELVGLAGVSKTTFYEHFADKDECFLATFDAVVETASAQIGEAYRSRNGLRGRLAAALAAFVEIVVEQPGAARLVVVDSLGLGVRSIPHRDSAAARFELMLRQSFEQEPERGEVSELTVRAIVGGIRRVVYRSLRSGHPQELREHTGELLEWALGHQPVSGGRAAAKDRAGGGQGDSPGWGEPPDSPRSRATLSQRERIVRAAALVATEGGYAGLSVRAVSTCAGVSKQTFYEHFPNKQAAFIAAYDAEAERALAIAAAAFATQEDWAEGIRAGIEALLRHIAADRVYARLSFFELPAAGTDALDRGDRAQEGFTAFLDPEAFGASTPLHPPPIVIEAISGGTWAAIQHEITTGREAELPHLAPELAAIVLTPFGLGSACRAAP